MRMRERSERHLETTFEKDAMKENTVNWETVIYDTNMENCEANMGYCETNMATLGDEEYCNKHRQPHSSRIDPTARLASHSVRLRRYETNMISYERNMVN